MKTACERFVLLNVYYVNELVVVIDILDRNRPKFGLSFGFGPKMTLLTLYGRKSKTATVGPLSV